MRHQRESSRSRLRRDGGPLTVGAIRMRISIASRIVSMRRLLECSAVVASFALLAACGYSTRVSSSSQLPSLSDDNVVAMSPSSTVSVAIGSSMAVSVTFITDDGATATNLSVTGLGALPAGWSGPASFTCATVSSGSGCTLNLTYQPTAVDSGSVSLAYGYTNNAGTSKTGSVMISYSTSNNDNIVATASPVGQIAVITGGSSTVGITFTTDDGQEATNLSITAGLNPLPAGWSGPSSFTCASVSTGNGCVLNLTYAPSTVASSMLTVSYAYSSNSGAAKTGTINIPYVATSQNHVIATTTPAGQIVAMLTHTQTVKVDFTTDDSNPASAFMVSSANLAALPSGWTGPATFTCASVATGNGCELTLTYAPTQIAGGTVTLNFSYLNNSGVAETGSLNIAYAATTDNTVIGTPSPSGTINAVVGQGSQGVTVTFNSNDGNPASNLAIASGLGTLPAGWSGPAAFSCASVNTGNACQLSLTFNPTTAESGTLQLNYSYNANSGAAKTGSVLISYAATTHNNLVVTQAPSGSISAMVNSGSVPVTLTFTTDDGNPATAITITSGLGALPSGWSAPATFSCATASTGTGCQLALTYAPTVNGSGSVVLGYSYTDDSGTAKTGTVSIAYASISGFLYVTDTLSHVVRCAVSGADGSLSACSNVAGGFSAPTGIAFAGNFAYVTPGVASSDVDVCPVNADGSFGTCSRAQSFGTPNALAVSGGHLYVADANGPGNIYSCAINSADGSLSACITNPVGNVNTLDGIAVTATTAFAVDVNGGNLSTCAVSPADGHLSACTQATLNGTTPAGGNTPNSSPRSVSVYGGNVYAGTKAGILILPIAANGTVTANYPCSLTVGTSCTDDTASVQTPVVGSTFNNGYAYVSGYGGGGGVGICTLEASGILDNCITSSSLNGYYGGMAVH
jgi:hypothetical protein